MSALRKGVRVTVDGWPGEVWRKHQDRVLIHWTVGEPLKSVDGKVLGWLNDQVKIEWLPLDSDRIGR